MEYLGQGRYDYFLIWGNGIPYQEEIIGIIRSKESFRIVRIMDHKPRSIARLVRAIYSYDYAPFHHLKSKTKYLLRTDPDVVFLFVRNEDAREEYRGKGAFRHIECVQVKAVKEEIRDRFNPRRNGKRTEEHVVHASDNDSQVHHILKYLGFRDGIRILEHKPNPVLTAPYYLPDFKEFTVRYVPISQLYCHILRGTKESYYKEPTPIGETPHFACLAGDASSYADYLAAFMGVLTCDYSVEKFTKLSHDFAYLQRPHHSSYILARELGPEQYIILDGVHRASILKWRGVDKLAIAVPG